MIKPIDPEWRRAKRCASGACVEVAKVADRYLIRDSKKPDTVLEFSEVEWTAFVGGLDEGDFAFD